MTALEWLALLVLLTCALAAGAAVTLSNGAVTRAIRRLERTYRRHKSLELEQLQARAVAARRAEVEALLARQDGWRQVLDQLLADAVPGARVGPEGVLSLSADPAPRFLVAGEADGRAYLFTTSAPETPRRRLRGRTRAPMPLDAALHPAARVEVQAVWEHLVARHPHPGQIPVLPRQAGWFLAIRQRTGPEASKRAPGLPGGGG